MDGSRSAPDVLRAAQRKAEYRRRLMDGADALAGEFAALSLEVDELKRRLRTYEHALRMLELPIVRDLAESVETVRAVDVPADVALSEAAGFYALEYTEDGTPYRWTGRGGRFRYSVHVDRSQALSGEIELVRLGDLAREAGRRAKLSIDGREASLTYQEGEPFDRLRFDMPAREGRGATTLVFNHPVWRPSDEGGEDDREMGVAVARLRIVSVG